MKIIIFRAKTLLIICLIIGVLLSTLYTPAVQSVFSASNGRSLPIYSVQTEEKKVAIGINCAWDDSDIPSMLSCLAEQEVNATFFLLGEWAEKYPVSAATIAKSGQEIGSHSYSHRDLDGLSQSEILNEISQSQQSIQKACGQTPVLFRPPSGSYNDTVSIKAAVFRFSGASTPWTGKGSPHRKLLIVFLTDFLPARLSCSMPVPNILHPLFLSSFSKSKVRDTKSSLSAN